MPNFDPTAIAILLAGFWAVPSLFRYFKTGQIFKTSQIKADRISIGSPVTRQLNNPDEAIKELDALKEQIKQSDKSGQRIFIIRRDRSTIAEDKPTEVKINNPGEEIKVLSDLEEKIRQSQESGNSVNFTLKKIVQQILGQAPISAFPTGVRFNLCQVPIACLLSPRQSVFCAIICAAAGALLLFVANDQRQIALASMNWLATEGHITKSYNSLPSIRDFVPVGKVWYSYTVNGDEYCGERIAYNPTWVQGHYDAPKRYPINSIVRVLYSKNDPIRSCLEVGNTNIIGQTFYLATICLAAALLFSLSEYNAWSKSTQN